MTRLLEGIFASTSSGDYLIDGSTRFDSARSNYLQTLRLFNANRQKFTISTWIKHDQAESGGSYSFIVSSKRHNSTIFIDPNFQLSFVDYSLYGANYPVDIRSSAKLRDHTGWYHILVSVDTTLATSTDRVKMYVNGERITSFATSTFPPRYYRFTMLSDDSFAIGTTLWGSTYYSGYMTEFYYADGKVLGPNDFLEDGLFNQKKPIEFTGDLGRNGFYLPLRSKFSFKELGMNYSDRNVGGDPFFSNNAMLLLSGTNVGGNNLTITDSSSNNFSITYTGAPGQGGESPFRRNRDVPYDPSLDGQSIHFNGPGFSDCVFVPASSNANIGTGDFTIEFWMKSKSYATDSVYRRMWMLDGPTQNSSSQNLQILQDAVTGGLYVWTGTTQVGTITGNISDGSWHHIAVTRKSGTTRAFIDGEQLFAVSDSTNYTANSGSPRMRIGGYDSSTGRFNGLISNLRLVVGTAVYDQTFDVPTEPLTAISGTQLLLKESAINIFDAAGIQPVGTIGSTAVANDQTSYRSTSIRIPANSYLRMPSDILNEIGTRDFCFEMWIRFNGSAASKFIFGSSNGGGSVPKFGMYTNASGQLQIDINGAVALTSSSGMGANSWYHVAVVRENGYLHIYRSGRKIGTVANSSNIGNLVNPFYVGWFGEGSINFDGWIDQFRVTINNARYYGGFMTPSYEFPLYGPKSFYPLNWDWTSYYGDDPEFPSSLYHRYPVAKLSEFNSATLATEEPNPDPYARGLLLALSGKYLDGANTTQDLNIPGRIYGLSTITRSGVPITNTNNGGGVDGSFEFSGNASEYLAADLPYDISTDDFTIEFDIRCTDFYDSGLFRRIFWMGDSLSNSLSMNVDASGNIVVRWNDTIIITSSSAINESANLYHICLVREYYGNLTLYINGVNRGSTTFQSNISAASSAGPVYFGNTSMLNAPFSGNLANIRIYRIAKVVSTVGLNGSRLTNTSNGPARRYYPYAFESPTAGTDSDGNIYGTFMTMNAGNSINSTITGGGLEYTGPGNNCGAWGTMPIPPTGQWFIDVYDLTGDFAFMLDQNPSIVSSYQVGGTSTSLQAYVYGSTTNIVHNGSTSSFTNWTNSDGQRITIFFDMDANKFYIIRNADRTNPITYTFNSSLKSNPLYFGYKVSTTWPATTRHYYFGESRSYSYGVSQNRGYELDIDGKTYYPVCNYTVLSEPSIADPSAYFDTVLYQSNNGGVQSIDDYNFSPDLLWIKDYTGNFHSAIFDKQRGAGNALSSSKIDIAEYDETTGMISFDSNGFSLNGTGYYYVNNATDNNVAWSWKEDPNSGFDIVTYTGNGTTNQTLSHSLGALPDMIWIKNRTSVNSNWIVEHKGLGTGRILLLNSNQAQSGSFPTEFRFANRTSTTFQVGSASGGSNTNTSGNNYVAYLWTSIPGFSSIGTFVGNGSTNGTFIHTGFRPAFVLIKSIGSSGSWNLMDNRRLGYNANNYVVYPDLTNAQQGYTVLDLLSNGFKLRSTNTGTGSFNVSGELYAYAAFAEAPEIGSLAR